MMLSAVFETNPDAVVTDFEDFGAVLLCLLDGDDDAAEVDELEEASLRRSW